MIVNVFNKAHFLIEIGHYKFKPFEEIQITHPKEDIFRLIRSNRNLRLDKVNNEDYKKRHNLCDGNRFNFCYDTGNQHQPSAYKYVIESLSNPIIKFLAAGQFNYVENPLKKINMRFFSSYRLNQQGKCPVGPRDIFMSHGIGDKNYWKASKINDYKYAFVPGPAWEKRMRNTGYKGEIFITGYTKLDPLINGEYKKTERKKPYILWMPTHGYNNKNRGRSSFPQCLELINQISNKYETGLALHPTSKLNNKVKHTPTIQELFDADIVIADAGSNIYEAWILGKPVIFPHWLCAKSVLTHFADDPNNFEYQIYSKKIGYHAKDMKELNKMIDIALTDGMRQEETEFIEKIYPEKIRGKAGELAAKSLLDIAKSLNL